MSARARSTAWLMAFVTLSSLVAAAVEGKPDWLSNIPAGLVIGGVVGWWGWPLSHRFVSWLDRRSGPPAER